MAPSPSFHPTSFDRHDENSASSSPRLVKATSSLRWLILASLGYAAGSGCGGRSAGAIDAAAGAENPEGSGGNAGSAANDPGRGPYAGRGGAATGGGPTREPPPNHAGSTGVAGAGVEPSPPRVDCVAFETIGNGFERCSNGRMHRPAAGNGCPSGLPRPAAFSEAELQSLIAIVTNRGLTLETAAGLFECIGDVDCTAANHGHCVLSDEAETGLLTQCRYGCLRDSECGEGAACLCGSPAGHCVAASCRTDAECGANLWCLDHDMYPDCNWGSDVAFACQDPADECVRDSDCPSSEPYCALAGNHRACTAYGGCPVIGRPFLVNEELRTATPSVRDDWSNFDAPALERAALPPELTEQPGLRRALGVAWLDLGLLEHASIASFARFSLQLLSLGAPPDLLLASARAMADETRHARACFALASRYLGREVGPGPLDVSHALDAVDLATIVTSAVREGCIGETAAALEATYAAEACKDVATRCILETIAREETEHAELAWRFVAWALGRAPLEVIEHVQQTFTSALADSLADEAIDDSAEAQRQLAFGIVSTKTRRALRRRALLEAILPCSVVMLASARTTAAARGPEPLRAAS